tara:strand:- start:5040 stop:5321 length:282 start_codon:yes stop_codon:yes gene_type:complete
MTSLAPINEPKPGEFYESTELTQKEKGSIETHYQNSLSSAFPSNNDYGMAMFAHRDKPTYQAAKDYWTYLEKQSGVAFYGDNYCEPIKEKPVN